MTEPQTSKKEEWMKYAIHWLLHDAEIAEEGNDDVPDVIEVVGENETLLSEIFFPSVIRIYRVGSRAEKTNIFAASDIDNIYEVGPGAVSIERTCLLSERISLSAKKTQHDGFYQIVDKKGKFIEPKQLQIAVAKYVSSSPKELMYKTESSAAVTEDGEDHVISFRLTEWPVEVAQSLDSKLKWFQENSGVTDLPLFLVRKSHVDSENKNLEWRLSFSVVEKEIIKKIPPIPKRAFMICKELMAFKIFKSSSNDSFPRELWKSFFLRDEYDTFQENNLKNVFLPDLDCRYNTPDSIITVEKISKMIKDKYNPLTTYHWKTALLKMMDETWGKAERSIGDLYDMVRELIEFVLQAVKKKSMSNYFLPNMNLYHKFTDKELKSCKDLLEEMLNDFPETIKTLVFSKNYNVNFGGDGERYHLLPYQRFDEFHQEIKDVPKVLLLEGYYTFLTSMFTCDLKNPSNWFTNAKDSSRLEHSIKHAFFLKRMVQHLGLCKEDDQQFLANFNDGFKSLTVDFPITKFIILARKGDSILHLPSILEFAPESQNLPSQLLVLRVKEAPSVPITSSIFNMLVLLKNFCISNQQSKLKAESVMKYIDIDGQIKIAELKNDIQQHFDHECCEKVVKHLSYNFKQDEPELIKWLQPENVKECMGLEKPDLAITWAKPPLLEDIKCTVFDLLWKILEPVLKAENQQWMSIAEDMRNSLLNSIREQSDE